MVFQMDVQVAQSQTKILWEKAACESNFERLRLPIEIGKSYVPSVMDASHSSRLTHFMRPFYRSLTDGRAVSTQRNP
jgi:hypothetical protein